MDMGTGLIDPPPDDRWAWGRGPTHVEETLVDQQPHDLCELLQHALKFKSGIKRASYAAGMAAAAAAAPYDDCAAAAPRLTDVLRDAEADVRIEGLRQLAQLGALMCDKDEQRAASDLQHVLLPMVLPLTLDDHDEVARQAVLVFAQLVSLLPHGLVAPVVLHAVHRLESRGAEEAAVAAARLFAHSAASWSETALHECVPEILRRWCSHRDFSVREAIACCLSLVGEHLTVDSWQRALLPWFTQLCRDHNWRVRRGVGSAALNWNRWASS